MICRFSHMESFLSFARMASMNSADVLEEVTSNRRLGITRHTKTHLTHSHTTSCCTMPPMKNHATQAYRKYFFYVKM